MIERQPAIVRPRVIIPEQGAALLEDEVRVRLERGATGLIVLAGRRGSGRSTAIAYLASVLGNDPRLVLIDGPPDPVIDAIGTRLVICTATINYRSREVWRLAPWTRDDCIEYLLAAHREKCASVMHRVVAEKFELGGAPELWRVVLDRLAEDDSLSGIREALWLGVDAHLPNARARSTARESCFTIICHNERESIHELLLNADRQIGDAGQGLLRHEPVRLLLAADYVCGKLRGGDRTVLADRFPPALIEETAQSLRGDTKTIERLHAVMRRRDPAPQPMAASLLHASGARWVPKPNSTVNLCGALLPGVRLGGIQLASLHLYGADVNRADLSEARVERVEAQNADLSRANLHGASLKCLLARGAKLGGANLSFLRGRAADFYTAQLCNADLEGAMLELANFERADLSGARFVRACLVKAKLAGANLDNVDFSGANLERACLADLSLNTANCAGAQFEHAILDGCNMEGMFLPGCSFVDASMQRATLTGTRISDGQFLGANLRGARLADIEWERADLRDADLSQCTFHLGSSRSGLVGSPLASEGTRTGFYTDEYLEQGFKAPEDIRKANLRGADLRGADIEHTDFYLVDLRDARYTSDQEEIFRRCRAILEARV